MARRVGIEGVISAHIGVCGCACRDKVSARWLNGVNPQVQRRKPSVQIIDSVVVACIDDFLTAVKAIGRNVVAQMGFT